MTMRRLPYDQILQGDSLDILKEFPENSVDVVFADPPYNLQLRSELWRPDNSFVDAVDNSWDQFETFSAYDTFCESWLSACKVILKRQAPYGSLELTIIFFELARSCKTLDFGS